MDAVERFTAAFVAQLPDVVSAHDYGADRVQAVVHGPGHTLDTEPEPRC